MKIRTSDLRFIRRGPSRLNYFLRIWVIYVGFLEPLVEVGFIYLFIFLWLRLCLVHEMFIKKGLNAKQVHVVCTKIKQALRFSKVSQMVLVVCKKTHLVPLLTFR
jgi:hypothetical protein